MAKLAPRPGVILLTVLLLLSVIVNAVRKPEVTAARKSLEALWPNLASELAAASTANKSAQPPRGGPFDSLMTEKLAETFLTRFLETKRIEDFVKSIPAGQEQPLEVFTALPVATAPSSRGWKVRQGEKEEVLVGLRNRSKTSSIIVFGILSNLTHASNPKEIYRKNKAATYSLELMPGHETCLIYPLTLLSPLEDRRPALHLNVHFMEKTSKLFGRVGPAETLHLEFVSASGSSRTGAWWWILDGQLMFIGLVCTAFLAFFGWIVFQAVARSTFLKRRSSRRRHSE